MNNKRINRISEEVKKVVSEMIFNGLKDPRISTMITVTSVDVTRDLSFANIYVSVLGDKKAKDEAIEGLTNAKGFIRTEIGKKIDLRHVPNPIFHLDESIEKGMHMAKLIKEVTEQDELNRRKLDE